MTDEYEYSVVYTFKRKDIEAAYGSIPDGQWDEFCEEVNWDEMLRDIIDWQNYHDVIEQAIARYTHKFKAVGSRKPEARFREKSNLTAYTEDQLQERMQSGWAKNYDWEVVHI